MTVTPIADFGRIQEAGRIRCGIKSGKAMKSIDTWRFTSPHEDVIEQLAARYGGRVEPWQDAKANPPNQFQVITDASSIDVVIPPSGIDTNYELYSGRGLQRICDGVTVNGWDWDGQERIAKSVPCICSAQGRLECKITTHVSVIFPWLPFRGMWRLDTKSWNAAHELPSMMAILEQMRSMSGLAEVELYIEKQTKMRNGQKAHYVVPRLRFKQSVLEMLEGKGVLGASIGSTMSTYELTTGDDMPVDAELVDE